jgi:hypothetical protein
VRREKPINADLPAPEPPEAPPEPPRVEEPKAEKPKPEPEPPKVKEETKGPAPPPLPRRRRHLSLTPFVLLALVLIAIGFIVAAVLGGGGGPKEESGAAPAPAAPSEAESAPESASAEALGYPAFATNNTTRVGGSDAAANAAAVALAVFPSTSAELRPPAVALVDEDDWAGAIAASVLIAPPVRAPLLYSADGEPPAPTAEALGALSPVGESSAEGASAFALGAVAAPVEGKVTRLPGGNPAAEAAAISALRDRLFGAGPRHFLIAPLQEPEFAMPAAAWAARSGDPVLFAEPERLPAPTRKALREHPGVPAYVLGPPSAISAAVIKEIARIADPVKRVSGPDPVANAIAFARYSAGDFGWNVDDPGHGFVLARSDSPLDAGAASALSASGTWGPLLLTDDAAKVPAELRSYFLDVKPGYTTNPTRAFYNHVWVIGDEEAIDVNQQAEVNELAELTKIGGGE